MKKFFIYKLIFLSIVYIAQNIYAQASDLENIWKSEIDCGFNLSEGNSKSKQIYGNFVSSIKNEKNDFSFKALIFYSSSNKEMDSQKWYSNLNYSFNFGLNNKWYNFYKVEIDHDKFTFIDYRIIPSSGIGYWFFNDDYFKYMIECGLGLEYTNFKLKTKSTNETILIQKAYIEKKIFKTSKISQEIIFYPNLNKNSFRYHSQSSLNNSLSDNLLLKLNYIYDYNSDPVSSIKKNDSRFICSIGYSF